MKKSVLICIAGILLASCEMDFTPTDAGSAESLVKDAESAITIVDGIYRSMWTAGWSTSGNTHECFGISAYNIALEAMGDDFVMQGPGNGWFWYDQVYNVKFFNSSSADRSYDVWFANYTWISNANYVISARHTMEGSTEDKSYVLGEAYGIRALAYFNLSNFYSRAPYDALADKSRWEDPGVPVYTEPADRNFVGKSRGTLKELYAQIDEDIDSCIVCLRNSEDSKLRGNKSHISLYTALGIKTRICLAKGDWQGALDCAKEVIESGEYSVGTENDLMSGMNDLSASNVMWGAGIEVTEQAGGYAGFFSHMDNQNGAYAKAAPKLISSTLYKQMGDKDIRRGWWDPEDEQSPYISHKFSFSNVSSWLGDYIYMRVEEMYFDAAEASLRLGDEDAAIRYMNTVMKPRDSKYNAADYTGAYLGTLTNTFTGSLLENILVNKRIELWGEFGRLVDVRRLGQGISRSKADGFSDDCLTAMASNGVDLSSPDNYCWVLTIPQDELDANPEINENDQNP